MSKKMFPKLTRNGTKKEFSVWDARRWILCAVCSFIHTRPSSKRTFPICVCSNKFCANKWKRRQTSISYYLRQTQTFLATFHSPFGRRPFITILLVRTEWMKYGWKMEMTKVAANRETNQCNDTKCWYDFSSIHIRIFLGCTEVYCGIRLTVGRSIGCRRSIWYWLSLSLCLTLLYCECPRLCVCVSRVCRRTCMGVGLVYICVWVRPLSERLYWCVCATQSVYNIASRMNLYFIYNI